MTAVKTHTVRSPRIVLMLSPTTTPVSLTATAAVMDAGDHVEQEPLASEGVTFGDFSFHFRSGFLYHSGRTVMLQHRAAKVLRYLLEHPREVVTREELIAAVWGAAHVSDASVNEAIKRLRKALQDDAANPAYIQTIQRRGYRFIAPVQEDPFDPAATDRRLSGARSGWIWDPRPWMATTLLLVIVLLLLLLFR